jgi:hypothetical protein
MKTFKTKYFGEITVDDEDFSDVVYENTDINIFFSDMKLYDDKVKICIDMLDKYLEINNIAKKSIIENFSKNELIYYYFECHFDALEKEELCKIFGTDDFKKLDIEKIVNGLNYPDLIFIIEDGEIQLSVDYMVSKEYSDEILCVKIDEKLNVVDYSHES